MLLIRQAETKDADACSKVLCASIRELCGADHHGDPDLVAQWIANKTPQNIARWIASPKVTLLLAERNGEPAGVGCVSHDGEVLLNYVAPTHRFCGVSRAILAHLEATLRQLGLRRARLSSTETAHRFYLDAGWVDTGESGETFSTRCLLMEKVL